MRFPRALSAALLATSAAVLFAACGDDRDYYEYRSPHADHCSSYATCGTCTPVSGCGWCTYEDGSGSCASEPDHCRGSTFRWNWEPESCSTPIDAGPLPDTTPARDGADAGDVTTTTDAPSSDGPSSDSSTDVATDGGESGGDATPVDTAPTTCTAPSRATVACVQTTGGTLCASGEYTLSCHAEAETGTPVPDGSLGCKAATTTSTATFYCCPCPTP